MNQFIQCLKQNNLFKESISVVVYLEQDKHKIGEFINFYKKNNSCIILNTIQEFNESEKEVNKREYAFLFISVPKLPEGRGGDMRIQLIDLKFIDDIDKYNILGFYDPSNWGFAVGQFGDDYSDRLILDAITYDKKVNKYGLEYLYKREDGSLSFEKTIIF